MQIKIGIELNMESLYFYFFFSSIFINNFCLSICEGYFKFRSLKVFLKTKYFDTVPLEDDGQFYHSYHDRGAVCSNALFLDPQVQCLHQAQRDRECGVNQNSIASLMTFIGYKKK